MISCVVSVSFGCQWSVQVSLILPPVTLEIGVSSVTLSSHLFALTLALE